MSDKLRVIQLGAHKVPEFKEERGKDWVLYGKDKGWKNQYPNYLLHLYNRSAKHHAIINGKVDYIMGNGWELDAKGLDLANQAKIEKFIYEPNSYESLDELTHKCVLDVEIYGGFALEVIWNKAGNGIAEIHHAQWHKYRVSKDGDRFFYHETWKGRIKDDEVETIDAFDPEKPKGKQLLYVKTYHPETDHYPLPQYLGCIPYVEIDSEIANFHYNAIKNGFMGGTVFQFFNGQPSEEEMEEIERAVEDKFCGTDNANRIMLLFSDSREQGMEIVEPTSNDFDKRYDILNKTTEQEIYGGHRIVDPALFGIKEEGIFTNRSQIRDSYELFKNTYVNQRQKFIERVFNGLASVMGFEGRLKLADSEPISEGYSEAARLSVMETDEIRSALGLKVQEQEDEQVNSKEKDAQATLKGSVGGVTGVITILQNINTGLVSPQSAVEMLINFYGFDRDTAIAIVQGKSSAFKEDSKKVLDEKYDEIQLCEAFKHDGLSLDEWEIVKPVREVRFESNEQAEKSEKVIQQFGTDDPFTMAVLNYLKETPTATYSEIAAALESSVESVAKAAENLIGANLLKRVVDEVVDTPQRALEVTPNGTRALETAEPLEANFKIAYRYVKSQEASGASVLPTTRDFCAEMVAQSERRVWTLAQIQQIGMRENRNVWLRRGGFWTRKGTNTTSPYCRHVWEQVIVRPREITNG